MVLTVLAVGTAGGAAARERTVRPGAAVTVVARGFVPFAFVTERIDASRVVRHVRADRFGTVTERIRAPRTLGRHRVVFTGRQAGLLGRPRPPVVGGDGDVQVLRAEIPRVVTVRFRVTRTGAGVAAVGAGRDPLATGPDRLAATGLDLRVPVAGAALLLLVGLALTTAGAPRTILRVRRDRHGADVPCS